MAALSPEALERGLTQFYAIGNPSKTLDIFVNPNEISFTGTEPAGCANTGTNTGALAINGGVATDWGEGLQMATEAMSGGEPARLIERMRAHGQVTAKA